MQLELDVPIVISSGQAHSIFFFFFGDRRTLCDGQITITGSQYAFTLSEATEQPRLILKVTSRLHFPYIVPFLLCVIIKYFFVSQFPTMRSTCNTREDVVREILG
jgi:hypothetical protein